MRLSRLFGQTLRDIPAGIEATSHQLLLRAGFIRSLSTGIFSYLPLARRSLIKIETIIREELNAIGGQEMSMPVVNPAEIWQETGRWYQIGSEMGRFKDKNGHDMVLAMTHEEVVGDLVRNEIHSYRQLPALIYHVQTKWRDDPRPRAGLIRAREFTMLDSYSLDKNWEGLAQQYHAHCEAYSRIFARCGLKAIAVQSDLGIMGGKQGYEFMYLSPIGEDTLVTCKSCGFAANQEIATFTKPKPDTEESLPLEKIATPQIATIEDLTTFLKIPASRTAKAVFLVASIPSIDLAQPSEEEFVFAIIRGDMNVNETKLANALRANQLRPATVDEIRETGAEPGFASPIGLKGILTVVDDLIPHCPNLVAGANETGYHYRNVNFGRDYTATIIADIASAEAGFTCPECEGKLEIRRGIELGHIFQLGTRYSESLGCTFLDEKGQSQNVIMGSYGIGLGRLLACIAEEHHDEKGLIWPQSVAPYPIHLIALAGKNPQVLELAETLYIQLCNAGLEPLLDDREDSPGIKFSDADLIGLPLRLTISERSLNAGGVEFKRRAAGEMWIVPVDAVLSSLQTSP